MAAHTLLSALRPWPRTLLLVLSRGRLHRHRLHDRLVGSTSCVQLVPQRLHQPAQGCFLRPHTLIQRLVQQLVGVIKGLLQNTTDSTKRSLSVKLGRGPHAPIPMR